MSENDQNTEIQGLRGEPEPGPGFHCKLFSDTVTKRLCLLRRRELEAGGGFSCDGCNNFQDSKATEH